MFLRVHVDLGLDHFVIKIVTFAGTLADTCEHGITTVGFRDVVDELHDQNGLADACAAEQPNLTALGVWCQKIDDLNAGLQDQTFGRLLGIGWCVLMDRTIGFSFNRAQFVHRLADDVDDAAQGARANRHGNRRARVGHFLTANETLGGVHRDRAD